MTMRPILFSAPMVRALLADRKTMTRRVVDPQPNFPDFADRIIWTDAHGSPGLHIYDKHCIARGVWDVKCPYGTPGDHLWVRETWQSLQKFDVLPPNKVPVGSEIQYPASWEHWVSKRRPSIHMCQWMSRITLKITGVRVERLQAITEQDARAEGVEHADGLNDYWLDYLETKGHIIQGVASAKQSFATLWDKINDRGAWDANPWVWVVEFRRVEAKP